MMRLNKWLILFYISCLVTTVVLGFYYRHDLLFRGWDSWYCFFIYLAQLALYALIAWKLMGRWDAMRDAESSLDLEADSR